MHVVFFFFLYLLEYFCYRAWKERVVLSYQMVLKLQQGHKMYASFMQQLYKCLI